MAAGKEEKKRLASKRLKAHSLRGCLHKLTLVALHGAEGSMHSLCQSCPSLRQFLSFTDIASHYCRVPINPPFIRPRVLIHFFFSPHISNSVWLLLFNPYFLSTLLHWEGNVKLYLYGKSVSSAEGKMGQSKGGGTGGNPLLGLEMKDLPKCQEGFDGDIDRIEAERVICILTVIDSSQSDSSQSDRFS